MKNLHHTMTAAVHHCCSYYLKAGRVAIWTKMLFTICLSLFFQLTNAQSDVGGNPFMNDANGRPLYLKSNYTSEGFPYYADSYSLAELTTMEGKVYRDVKVKINILENEIYYLAKDGAEMITTVPIRKIRLLSLTLENGAIADVELSSLNNPINKSGSAIYQVLADGKKSLVKKITVTYKDEQAYGNAGVIRTFDRKERLFAYSTPDKFEKVEKNVSSAVGLFPEKARQVQAFIDKNDLKCKAEADLVNVFGYYNSLFPKS